MIVSKIEQPGHAPSIPIAHYPYGHGAIAANDTVGVFTTLFRNERPN